MDTKKLMWDIGCGELTDGVDHYAVTPAQLENLIAAARQQGADEWMERAKDAEKCEDAYAKRIADLEKSNAVLLNALRDSRFYVWNASEFELLKDVDAAIAAAEVKE